MESVADKKKLIKGYKVSVIRKTRSGNLMYNIVTVVDNTIAYN